MFALSWLRMVPPPRPKGSKSTDYMVINWLKPPWTKETKKRESCWEFDTFILANIGFFHFVCYGKMFLVCVTTSLDWNPFGFSPSRWVRPSPLSQGCTCRAMGEVQLESPVSGSSLSFQGSNIHPSALRQLLEPCPSSGMRDVPTKCDLDFHCSENRE